MDVVKVSKDRVIKEFNKLLKRAIQGHQDNYQHILNLISYIESVYYLDNPIATFEKLMEDGN